VGPSRGGQMNDLALFKEVCNKIKLRKNECLLGDSIFAGINNNKKEYKFENEIITTKTQPLDHEKKNNATLASIRLGIENFFGLSMKKWNILCCCWKTTFEHHHKMWIFLCWLHNKRIINGEITIRNKLEIEKAKNLSSSNSMFKNSKYF